MKQVWDATRTLQDVFKKALTLEAGLQLDMFLHLGRPSQIMQVSVIVAEQDSADDLYGCVHQFCMKDNRVRSNACWRCGGIGLLSIGLLYYHPSHSGW